MMDLTALFLFLPACFALNMAPGPNNLLSLNHGTRHGFGCAVLAGVGRLLAFIGMMALAAVGLAAVLHASELLFHAIKLAGAGYLFYLAVQLWRARPVQEHAGHPARRSLYRLARAEFFLAAGNPKAIVIFTAFLPQFVDTARPVAPQFALVGLLFLALEWVAIAAYAGIGAYLGKWLARPDAQRLFNRCCATLLGAAGVGLLFARRAA